MDINLRDLVSMLEATVSGKLPGVSLNSQVHISIDSRKITHGQVFWALRGPNFDGHKYIEQCFKKGCIAAVVDAGWLKNSSFNGGLLISVKDTRRALGQLAGKYISKLSVPSICITGSNGKTTTKDMLKAVLSSCGQVLATTGNFNNDIGLPLTIFGLSKSHKFAVLEAGTNHPGEIRTLSRIASPEMAVITCIGYSHLEHFHNLRNVYLEKKQITSGFKTRGLLIVNGDDIYLKRMKTCSSYRVVKFGIHNGDSKPQNLTFDSKGCAAFLLDGISVTLKVPGEHNLYNALGAAAAGKCMGITSRKIANALNGFTASARRMQIKKRRGIILYDDCYNANPSSMHQALKVLGNVKVRGSKVAVLGDMLELGPMAARLHYEAGAQAADSGISSLFTTGCWGRQIIEGARASGFPKKASQYYRDITTLNARLMRVLKPGDAILVKASRGMKLERVSECVLRGPNA